MNSKRRLQRFISVLLFLTILALTPSLTPAEVITYDYDNAGQVKKVTYANGAAIQYTYDNAGNRLTYHAYYGPDTIPDPFSFNSLSNIPLNTVVESNAITAI